MAVKQVQSRFTVGELDPLLYGRSDTDFYYSGAKTMTNLLCLPEGGFTRRPGSLFIGRLNRQLSRDTTLTISSTRGGINANANDGNALTKFTTTTNIGILNPYIVINYDLGSQKDIGSIDLVNVKLTSASNNTEFFIQVSTNNIDWTTVGNALALTTTEITKRIRVQGTFRYVRFLRIGTTNLGTSKIEFGELNVWIESAETSIAKRIDFKFNIGQTYVIFLTDKNIAIYRNGVFKTDVRALAYEQDNIQTLNSTQSGDTAILFQENIPAHTLLRFDDTTWTIAETVFSNVSKHNFTSNVTNPAATLTPSEISNKVTITASAAVFSAGNVGQYIDGNGGRARIITFTSTTVVDAIMEIPFYDTSVIASGTWDLEQGWEAVWSNTRGWPRSGTFFQQRLWIGGSLSRPRSLWFSRVGEFFDFDIADARDSDAGDFDLDEDDPIVNLVANRTLQIFTTGGEAAILQSRLTPITPTNPSIVSQTRVGSEQGLKPVIIDGATMFMKNGGHSIGKFVFSEGEQSYNVTNITLLSSHLIDSPVDLTVRRVTNDEEASYLMIVNSDGTLTMGCMLDEQNVKGFSPFTTDGLYKNVATDKTTMYAVVERTIDGITNNYLEQFDFSVTTDSAVVYTTGLPTSTLTGLDHLEGEVCKVKADGNILPDVTVAGGSATISRDAITRCEIGLDYTILFESLPYENPEVIGVSMGDQKSIVEVDVRMHNTSSIKVNGTAGMFYGLSESLNPLDGVTPVFSGVKRFQGDSQWTINGSINITQDDPLPFTILSIGTRTSIS